MHHQITPGAVVLTVDQIELTVRALEGNVAVLEAADGSFFGYRHLSSLTLVPQAGDNECLPPATPTAPVPGLAAAAGAGQGAGTQWIAAWPVRPDTAAASLASYAAQWGLA